MPLLLLKGEDQPALSSATVRASHEAPMNNCILVTHQNRVTTVTINRAEKKNGHCQTNVAGTLVGC